MELLLKIGSFLAEQLGQRVLDKTISAFQRDFLRSGQVRFSPDISKTVDNSLHRLLSEVHNWSEHFEYSPDSPISPLHSVYIDLDCYVDPIAKIDEGSNRKIRMRRVLQRLDKPLILLGRPGYGKTTTVKAVCGDLLRGKSPLKYAFPIPLVIRLREVDGSRPLFDLILSMLQIEFLNNKDDPLALSDIDEGRKIELVMRLLNENRLLIIIDGFDEMPDIVIEKNNKKISSKDQFLRDFRQLCLNVNGAYVILTSRTADFPYDVQNTIKYEISSLSVKQIGRYIEKAIDNAEQALAAKEQVLEKKLLGAEFIPLTLTYICLIYKKYGRFFNSRRELYARLLDLILDEWDLGRGIKRVSAFAEFDSYDKRRFLKQISYELSCQFDTSDSVDSIQTPRNFFSSDQMLETFKKICSDYEGMSARDFRSAFREIESHTGIIIQAGSGYIFSHKTLQEYLFALYLIEYPEIPRSEYFISSFPNEVALAVSFNENPSMYFAYLMMNRTNAILGKPELDSTPLFLLSFLDRIILEETKFRVHPYLAVGFLIIYTRLIGMEQKNPQVAAAIKRFYSFLNSDRRLEISFSRLGEFYRVVESEKPGYLMLAREKPIDTFHGYSEPLFLYAPYELYELFLGNSFDSPVN